MKKKFSSWASRFIKGKGRTKAARHQKNRSLRTESLERRDMLSGAHLLGAEELVNTFVTNTQRLYDCTEAIAADAAGNYLVSYTSLGQDGSGAGVYAQRYSADGLPTGSEFRANTTTVNDQMRSSVAMAGDGSSLIVWESYNQDGDTSGVYAKFFGADGAPVSGEVHVSVTSTGAQEKPCAAALADGTFVVIWSGRGEGDVSGIFGRHYASDGTALSGEVRVNSVTAYEQTSPAVAALPTGGFVVAWESAGNSDGDATGVYFQRFDASFNALGSQTLANTTTASFQQNPAIGVGPDGQFALAWQSNIQDGSLHGIYAQRFNSSGEKVGGEIQVNDYTDGDQLYPSVAFNDHGGFAIAYNGKGPDEANGVYVREFAANGTALGDAQRVNTTTDSAQQFATIKAAGPGYVLVWSGKGVGDSDGVFLRRMGSAPVASGIADVSVNEDAEPTSIDLHAAFEDPENADSRLTYTVTSNTSTGLFSAVAIVDGELQIAYAPNIYGAAQLVVRATDPGGLYSETPVAVNVAAVNDAPTAVAIPAVTVEEDAANTTVDLNASFDDADNTDGELAYQIVSNNNPGLLSATVLEGGQLQLSYAPDAFGDAQLTIRATDPEGLFVETALQVTVTPVNDAPTAVGIADVNVEEDAADTAIDLVPAFGDIDNAASELTYTVVGNTNPDLFRSVTVVDGQLVLAYTLNAYGTATLTVRATDPGGSFAETSLAVNVAAVNDPPVIGRLLDSPDPVINGAGLRLEAADVTDVDSTVRSVTFYRDSNRDGVFTPGTDQLLGTDTNGADGWSISVSTAGFGTDAQRYFAVATDDQGAASAPATTTGTLGLMSVVDNSDTGVVETGTGWTDGPTGSGLYGNSRECAAGVGENRIQAALTGLAPGSYEVQVAWVAGLDRATNASYSVTDGVNTLGTVSVDQRFAPSGVFDGTTWWQSIGTFQTATGTIAIELSDNADGVVSADAVRLVSVAPMTLYFDADGNAANNVPETGEGLGGSGLWTGGNCWFNPFTGQNTTWVDGAQAVFTGTGGTITLPGPISASKITFSGGNFTIEAGQIDLPEYTGAIIEVAAGTTVTISSTITGSGGLWKSGGGTLVLTGENSYTGGTQIDAGTLQIGNGGETGSIAGDVIDDGSLIFNRSGDVAFAGNVSGTGTVLKLGGGTLALTSRNIVTSGMVILSGIYPMPIEPGTVFWDPDGNASNNSLTTGAGMGGSGRWSTSGNYWYDPFTGQNVAWTDGRVAAFLGAGGTVTISGQVSPSRVSVGSGAFTIRGGYITPPTTGGTTFDIASAAAVTVNSVINGKGGINKIGGGSLTLTATNTFTGTTSVTGGVLSVRSLADVNGQGSNLGTAGFIFVYNATLQYTGTQAASTARFRGATRITGETVIDVTQAAGSLTLKGGYNNTSQSLSKIGAGTLVLSGENPAGFGPAAVHGGTLVLAAKQTAANTTIGGVAAVDAGATLKFAPYTDGVSYRQLNPSADQAFTLTGGTLDLNGDTVNRLPSIDGAGVITNTAAGTTAVLCVSPYGDKTFSGTIQDGAGQVAVRVGVLPDAGSAPSTNAWTLAGANTYTGGTTITGDAILRLGADNALPSASVVQIGDPNHGSGILNLNGHNQTLAGLISGEESETHRAIFDEVTNTSATAAKLTVNNAADIAYAGFFAGNLAIDKFGEGKWTVSGVNTNTGDVAVFDGILNVVECFTADCYTIPGFGDPQICGKADPTYWFSEISETRGERGFGAYFHNIVMLNGGVVNATSWQAAAAKVFSGSMYVQETDQRLGFPGEAFKIGTLKDLRDGIEGADMTSHKFDLYWRKEEFGLNDASQLVVFEDLTNAPSPWVNDRDYDDAFWLLNVREGDIASVQFRQVTVPGYGELQTGTNPDGGENQPRFLGGDRFFPDYRTINEASTMDGILGNNIVRVRATVTGAIVGDTVYFRAYDVDDPSTDPIIDPNGDGPSGGNDNRGRVKNVDCTNTSVDGAGLPDDSVELAANTHDGFPGYLREVKADGTTGCWRYCGSADTATTSSIVRADPATGELYAEVDLATSFAPGDNFRVAANFVKEELQSLAALPTVDEGEKLATATPQLSVWRRFHVECDRMASLQTIGVLSGKIVEAEADPSNNGLVTLYLDVPFKAGEEDFSGGTLYYNNHNYPIISSETSYVNAAVVVGSLDDYFFGVGVECTIYQDHFSSIPGKSVAQLFKEVGYDEVSDTSLTLNFSLAPVAGTAEVEFVTIDGFGPYRVTSITGADNCKWVVATDRQLPETLDGYTVVVYRTQSGTNPPTLLTDTTDDSHLYDRLTQGSTDRTKNSYADAYMEPEYDALKEYSSTDGEAGTFVSPVKTLNIQNIPTTSQPAVVKPYRAFDLLTKAMSSDLFWCVYVTTAFRNADSWVGLRRTESSNFLGCADLSDKSAAVFLDKIRLSVSYGLTITDAEVRARVTVHEIGHLFWLEHNDKDEKDAAYPENIMKSVLCTTDDFYFLPACIAGLRKTRENPSLP